jgi:2-polyprenyl-6-methoxyphenol hydroxylase-like FAD-dependent oxidoreductase
MDVLISGVGIAGPTLAYWLRKRRLRPCLVERAPALRRSGYIVDFWGTGFDVADRMGLVPTLRERGYMVEEVRLVGDDGRRVGGFSAKVFQDATQGRYVSLPRGDLSAAIYDALPSDVETIWGDEIGSIQPEGEKIGVSFKHAPPRSFDIVVGADGLHSNVRRLCFGPEDSFERYLGYKVAAFETQGYRPRDGLAYVSHSEPGTQIARFAMRGDATMFLFVWRDNDPAVPHDESGQRRALHHAFAGAKWETADILAALDASADTDLYYDRASQIRAPSWSKGSVALVGDAAAAPSLMAGEGSALGMTEAYVLAGELANAPNDIPAALARYEQRLRGFIDGKQKAAVGFAASFAPKTEFGIKLRNLITHAFGFAPIADLFLGASMKDDFALPGYN